MLKICENSIVSIHQIMFRYIQIFTKLWFFLYVEIVQKLKTHLFKNLGLYCPRLIVVLITLFFFEFATHVVFIRVLEKLHRRTFVLSPSVSWNALSEIFENWVVLRCYLVSRYTFKFRQISYEMREYHLDHLAWNSSGIKASCVQVLAKAILQIIYVIDRPKKV
jgi:hypothetical protein